ncbi:hypothetical protein M514_02453 [Trichuris suis]|uniref:Uncharacterized protein n=1 Tax=Trichuris suis TaxID=68888 RepID=A0A085NF71_9BILA|nr:hypothetical protein M513_02453 [Trichuris suis]KFD68117.1 hypothetical protein M514_02453 [Trichuris suis]
MQKQFGKEAIGQQPYERLVTALTDHWTSKTQVVAARFQFSQMNMKPGQTQSGLRISVGLLKIAIMCAKIPNVVRLM